MEDYFQSRRLLENNDIESQRLPIPSTLEILANSKLNQLKQEFSDKYTIDEMLDFWAIRDEVIETKLFQVLKQMPKGAILHLHYGGTLPGIDVLNMLKNDQEVYIKFIEEKIHIFSHQCENGIKISDYLNSTEKEQELLNTFEMNRAKSLGLPNQRWVNFEQIFSSTMPTYLDKRILEKYLELTLTQFYHENLQRIELRYMASWMHENGTSISLDDEIRFLKDFCDDFCKTHMGLTIGIILSSHKLFSKEKIIQEAEDVYRLHQEYPGFILGFDLLGEEEKYREDEEVYECLNIVKNKAKNEGYDFPMFIHAGEVVSKHAPIIYDAFALETKRLGHGISLMKHPHLMKIAKEKHVTIECCPISNMLLGYVRDPRVHPGLAYLCQGLPVSISSDDPGLFGYRGVTHDWVWICILWGIDLMQIKKLIECSISGSTENAVTQGSWEPRWLKFIEFLADIN